MPEEARQATPEEERQAVPEEVRQMTPVEARWVGNDQVHYKDRFGNDRIHGNDEEDHSPQPEMPATTTRSTSLPRRMQRQQQ